MASRRAITSLILGMVFIGSLGAQTVRKATPRTIFEALEGGAPGEGTVVIIQPEEIRRLVGGTSSRLGVVLGREGNTSLLMGYRIQFYNANLPGSKAEAERRAAQIRSLAPEYGCYVNYNAPFWRLAVGDFRDMASAREARATLLKILPSWARESYVVRDQVRIINYDPNETNATAQ